MRWLVVIALAACGGAKSAATTEPAPTAEPRDAGPTRADLEAEMVRVEGLTEQACACEDAACLEEVDRAMAAYVDVATLPDPVTGATVWPEDLDLLGVELFQEMLGCFATFDVMPAATINHFTLRRLELFGAHACACVDDACRAGARDELDRLDDDQLVDTDRSDIVDRFRATAATLARCLDPVLGAWRQDAILELRRLRDQACACPDLACAGATSQAMLAWVQAKGTAAHVLFGFRDVADVAVELNACVKALM